MDSFLQPPQSSNAHNLAQTVVDDVQQHDQFVMGGQVADGSCAEPTFGETSESVYDYDELSPNLHTSQAAVDTAAMQDDVGTYQYDVEETASMQDEGTLQTAEVDHDPASMQDELGTYQYDESTAHVEQSSHDTVHVASTVSLNSFLQSVLNSSECCLIDRAFDIHG